MDDTGAGISTTAATGEQPSRRLYRPHPARRPRDAAPDQRAQPARSSGAGLAARPGWARSTAPHDRHEGAQPPGAEAHEAAPVDIAHIALIGAWPLRADRPERIPVGW